MTSRISALVLLGSLLLASTPTQAFAQDKIGVVDLQRALNETEDGRKAKNQLKKLFEDRQKTLDAQQEKLRTMKEDLEKQKNVLSREVMAKKLEEYQKAFAELQSTYMDYQRELGGKEADLTKDILARMQEIARRIGQKEGYTMILDRGEAGVLYVPSTYDLTDVLIQRYNAGEGGKSAERATKKPKAKKK